MVDSADYLLIGIQNSIRCIHVSESVLEKDGSCILITHLFSPPVPSR